MPPTRSTSAPLPPGTEAPAFTLPSAPDASIPLSDSRGRPVVLIFYPADFSPVCSDELALFNELLPELEQLGAQVLGISVDGIGSHQAFARERGLRFPLLSDFDPKGEVSRHYHAFRDPGDYAERALYVIDGDGLIFWSGLWPPEVNPGADGVLDALERLTGREVQPEVTP